MLSGQYDITKHSNSNRIIWFVMTLQAGILNIGGFMACGRFVSHVTGFATFFGYELAKEGNFSKAISMLSVPVFFLIGSMISGFLVDIRIQMHKNPKYYLSFGLVFILVLMVYIGGIGNYFGNFGEELESIKEYFLLILLCLSCGIQNGMITSISKSVVRTTHLTGITTDLGIGIMRYLFRGKITAKDESEKNFIRIGILLSFIFGSIIGGYSFSHFGYSGFLIPVLVSGALFLLMLKSYFVKPKIHL